MTLISTNHLLTFSLPAIRDFKTNPGEIYNIIKVENATV